MIQSEEAVSEVVDFTVLLGIMILALGIVYVFGYPALLDLQEAGHIENLEQSFIVMGSNLNRVVLDKAPSQSVELKIYGGSISVHTSGSIEATVTVWNQTSSSYDVLPHLWNSTTSSFEATPVNGWGEVRCEYEDVVLSYQGTGVWAKYPEGCVMLSEPQIISSDKLVVVPFSAILGSSSISGEGLLRISAEGSQTTVTTFSNVSRLDINITSDYNEAWSRYLNQSQGMTTNETDGTVHAYIEYPTPRDAVFVQKRMDVWLE